MNKETRGALLVLGGALIISLGPLLVRLLRAGATETAFYRMFFGALVLLLSAALRREKLRPRAGALAAACLAGAAFSGDLFFWHRSIFLAGPGLSTILANFQVFILAGVGALFLGERLAPRFFISVALAFAGLGLLLEADLRSLPPDLLRGIIYGLITSLFLSCYILLLRHSRALAAPLGLIPNMAWVSLSSAFVLGALLLLEGGSFALAGPGEAFLLLLYGAGCQAAGWLMVSAGLPWLSPAKGALLLMLEPLCAFIWELLFLDRPTGPAGYIGLALVMAAIALCLAANAPRRPVP